MSLEQRINGVLISDRVRMSGGVDGWPSSAWYGEPMTSGITLDDPDGELDLNGWETYTADETSCAKPRICTGWITNIRVRRGPYLTGPGRIWELDITDQNAAFGFELFRASSAKRPAETDVARVQFAIASAPMAGTPVYDNGRFPTTPTTNFGAADYVTQYPIELFTSVAGSSGKNFYAYWDNDAEQISLHYDLTGNNPVSVLTISNRIQDVDNDQTFFPYLDGVLERDPMRIVTGLLFGYLGGNYVYERDSTQLGGANEFSPDAMRRDELYRTDRVGLLATAEALAAQYLADRATPKETVKVTVRLPASKVNLAHAGDAIGIRLTHLPLPYSDPDDYTPMAVIRRTVVPTEGRRDFYDVTLELSNDTDTRRGPGAGEGPVGEVVVPARCEASDVSVVQSVHGQLSDPSGTIADGINTVDWPVAPTPGNLLVCVWTLASNTAVIGAMTNGWQAVQTDAVFNGAGGLGGNVSMFWKVAEETEVRPETVGCTVGGSNFGWHQAYLFEFAGVDALDSSAIVSGLGNPQSSTPDVLLTPTAGNVALLLGAISYHTTLAGTITPNAGQTELWEENAIDPTGNNPQRWIAYQIVDGTTGSYNIGGTFASGNAYYGGIAAAFYCTGADIVPPLGGSAIKNEFVADGDGSTTTFQTAYSYVPGSLEVFVDGVPIINGLTETDPDAGEFTLDFAPLGASGDTRAERVTVNYVTGRGPRL